MSKKPNSILSNEDIQNGVMPISKLDESTGYQPSHYRETLYNIVGKEDNKINETDVYAKKIVNGNQQVKYFIKIDSQGMPVNPSDKEMNKITRKYSSLLGTPATRLVPVTPATFASYIAFLETGNMGKYHNACRV